MAGKREVGARRYHVLLWALTEGPSFRLAEWKAGDNLSWDVAELALTLSILLG